jgi:hypothetical protein
MVKEADQAGYDVLIIDSLSHAWAGQGGLLEEVDKRKSGQKNQIQRIQILCKELGINDREERMQRVNKFLQHTSGRTVTSTTDLTQDEAQKLISKLDNMKQQQPQEATV